MVRLRAPRLVPQEGAARRACVAWSVLASVFQLPLSVRVCVCNNFFWAICIELYVWLLLELLVCVFLCVLRTKMNHTEVFEKSHVWRAHAEFLS